MATSTVRRRSQRERRETTIDRLVSAARLRFATDGYEQTTLDAVVEEAGLTKGALYHHFAGKRELFLAVYEREQLRLIEASRAAHGRRRDPCKALLAGCEAFFAASLDPAVQLLTLIDAPVALGWEGMRAAESEMLDVLELGLRHAIDSGCLPARPSRPLAILLFGAICEAAMHAARAPEPAVSQRAMLAELRRLVAGLTAT